jgi:xylan 1,4-beta-xylosidase
MMLLQQLLLLPAAAATTTAATVDLAGPSTPFVHYWKRCVGSGHMALGTRQDWRDHLKLAHDELGFVGVRGHGLLDDDMSVMPTRNRGGIVDGEKYEWYNVDQVYDYMISLGVRPVVELSFMPSALVTCGTDGGPDSSGTPSATGLVPPCSYVHGNAGGYKGLQMPPDDFNDWYELVHALATHLTQRYGPEEVSQWHFEVL